MDNVLKQNVDLALRTDNNVQFPYDKLVLSPWGANIFIVFADSGRGSDLNDGRTLATAKKTINGALAALPDDLAGHEAWVIVHPGTYTNEDTLAPINCIKSNGMIKFEWLGTCANLGDVNYVSNDLSEFIRLLLGGASVLSNDPIVVVGKNVTSSSGAAFSTIWTMDKTLSVIFESCNFGKAWNAAGSQYAYRWKFMQDAVDYNASVPAIVYTLGLKSFATNNPIEVDFTNALNYAVTLEAVSGRVDGIKLTSSVLSAINTKTDYWSGLVFVGEYATETVWLTNVYYPAGAYNALAPKDASGFGWVVEGCRQFINFVNGCKALCDIGSSMVYNQGVLPDAVIPVSYFRANAKASLTYNSTKFTVNDTSIEAHYVKDLVTGIARQYLGSGFSKVGSSTVQQVHTSVIADADLANKDISFSLDETGHNLKLKVKYSTGTVKTADIALV